MVSAYELDCPFPHQSERTGPISVAMSFGTISLRLTRQSPGALLLRHQIEEASRQGLAFYDIGVGAARHKDQWAHQVQPLFDNFIALSRMRFS
jgi:CelD/BcsL family acetyltransferase involved in cellulose biosynthesis